MDKQEIRENLFKLGLKPKYQGFELLVEALWLISQDLKYLKITNNLIPALVVKFGKNSMQISNNLRRVIQQYNKSFTTSEFLASYPYLIKKL